MSRCQGEGLANHTRANADTPLAAMVITELLDVELEAGTLSAQCFHVRELHRNLRPDQNHATRAAG